MKKVYLSYSLVFLSLMLASSFTSKAQITINNSANTYASIASAIGVANNGDVINVGPGIYSGNVTINKSVTLKGANSGVSGCKTRGAESIILDGAFIISSNGVTIDGFAFTGTGARMASSGSGSTWSHISIINNNIYSTTAPQPILHGSGFGGGIGTINWSIKNNRIDNVLANAATAISVSNIDGVEIINNCITHTNAAFLGRRGINADGLRNATITGNKLNLGDPNPVLVAPALQPTPWALQLSMADRSTDNILISENEIKNSDIGIVGLSQRSLSNVKVYSNEITGVRVGIGLNFGQVVPLSPGTIMSGIEVKNNTINSGGNRAIFFRNLHSAAVNGPVAFNNVVVNGNSLTRNSAGAIMETEAGLIIQNGNIDARCNWWGTADGTVITSRVLGKILFAPYLTSGADGPAFGFQPQGSCTEPVPTISFTASSSSGSTASTDAGNPSTVSVNFCNGANLILSGFNRYPAVRVGALEKLNSSGNVFVGGGAVPADRAQTDIAPSGINSYFNNSYNNYAVTNGAAGWIDITYTPYFDADNSNSYTPGDILGSPVLLRQNIYAPPTMACQRNISVSTDPVLCSAVVNYNVTYAGEPNASISYSFANATTGSGTGTGTGSSFNKGTTTVTVTITTSCGTVSCSFDITVDDKEAPTITCPADVVLNPTSLLPQAVTLGTPTVGDNCPGTTYSNNAPATFAIGTTTNVTWTATDAAGNTSTCVQKVTVRNPYCDNNSNSTKVFVCHNGKTQCVSVNAWPALQAKGWILGECSWYNTTISRQANPALTMLQPANTKPSVYPNPTSGDVNISLPAVKSGKAEIIITNVKGMITDRKMVNVTGLGQIERFNLRRHGAGMYHIQILTEEGVQNMKVIIQR